MGNQLVIKALKVLASISKFQDLFCGLRICFLLPGIHFHDGSGSKSDPWILHIGVADPVKEKVVLKEECLTNRYKASGMYMYSHFQNNVAFYICEITK
jgi:hypothetical protein